MKRRRCLSSLLGWLRAPLISAALLAGRIDKTERQAQRNPSR